MSTLPPPVFQGTAVSCKCIYQHPPKKCSGSARVAASKEVSRAARSATPGGPPLQGIKLVALSTPEASLVRLAPLVGHLAVWEPLPNVSHWVLP